VAGVERVGGHDAADEPAARSAKIPSALARIGRSVIRAQVDSQVLAFLIEMAALKPQRLGSIRDVIMLPLELYKYRLAFELEPSSARGSEISP
jgi:hypothetical protein